MAMDPLEELSAERKSPGGPPPPERGEVRHFHADRPVPESSLRRILRSATLAPSSFNLQPWRFVIVREPRNLQRLRECAFNEPRISEAAVVVIVLSYHNPHRSHLDPMIREQVKRGALTEAQAAEAFARASRALEASTDRASWAARSTMMAAKALVESAENLGIASAFIDQLEPRRLALEFGIPDDHTALCLIALGFAAEIGSFAGRFDVSEVTYDEHFGQPSSLDADLE